MIQLLLVYFCSFVFLSIALYLKVSSYLVSFQTIFLPLIFIFGFIIIFAILLSEGYYERIRRFVHSYLIDFSTKSYNENNGKWIINYLIVSYVYFAIFFIYFYFIPHKSIVETAIASWFGFILLRFIHYTKQLELAKHMAKLVIEFMLPFGVILYLYLWMFIMHKTPFLFANDEVLLLILSSLFIFSTLGAEIFINILFENLKNTKS